MKTGLIGKVALVEILAILGGCSYIPYKPIEIEQPVIKCETSYQERKIKPKIELVEENEEYKIERVIFKSISNSYANENFEVEYYRNKSKGDDKKLVMLYSPANRVKKLMEEFSKQFVNAGFDAALMPLKNGFLWHEYSFDFSAQIMDETVDDSRVFMDWVSENNEATEFAVFGLSLGGIQASLLAGIEERIKAGSFVISGGDLNFIINNSQSDYVHNFKKTRMEQENLTEEEFISKIKKTSYCVDPITYAPNMDPKRFLLIYSMFDQVVPPEAAEKLREAMGNPETIKLWNNHYILGQKRYVLEKSVEKFKKIFNEKKEYVRSD